jgi:hypothetical protein
VASLVSLAQAREHLRVTTTDLDGDIWAKAQEATGIILDYLKTTRTTAIASISVANPTVITTVVPHSLTSGATSTIAGTTTTPTVVGAQVITVTGPYTFTVPVNVTVGQSTEAGTVASPVWTDATAPGQVKAAVKLVLEDLHEHRPIDWEVIRRLLERSRDPALA